MPEEIQRSALPSVWLRFLGCFFPVSIRKGASGHNARLELFYYRGRYVLATADAVYSDGHKYRPLVAAFNSPVLRPVLPQVSEVLVLGTGLASAVHVLHRMGHHPHFTLVEIDELVLSWAKEFLPAEEVHRVKLVQCDAVHFIEEDTAFYDLIIVDIFFGREVPEAVTGKAFLEACKQRLNKGGCLVLNFMPRSNESSDAAKAVLDTVFVKVEEISFGINRVYLAQ